MQAHSNGVPHAVGFQHSFQEQCLPALLLDSDMCEGYACTPPAGGRPRHLRKRSLTGPEMLAKCVSQCFPPVRVHAAVSLANLIGLANQHDGPDEAQPGRPGGQEAGAGQPGQDHPVVPFKGVEFFDVGGLLANPEKLQLTFDLFVHAVMPFIDQVDAIGCFDARGFLFAPYLGALFQKRVFMLRKPDKMPSVSDTIEYFKEYKGETTYAVNKGDRVLLVDDCWYPPRATGRSLSHGLHLRVEIGVLNGRGRPSRQHGEKTQIISLLTEKDF
ncbi:Phosphoribosyltransferase-like [Phytophthora cactorum]|nr:Phosphoribosyltransferase-like [Phytophthora cactorum]